MVHSVLHKNMITSSITFPKASSVKYDHISSHTKGYNRYIHDVYIRVLLGTELAACTIQWVNISSIFSSPDRPYHTID